MESEKMNKTQWQKPVVQKLDISKTKSGFIASEAEGVFVGIDINGNDVFGNDAS